MHRVVIATAALFASSALGQQTRLIFEASLDNQTWSGQVGVGPEGGRVHIRIRAVYDAAGTTYTTIGFGGITYQPTLTGWTAADVRDPFTNSLPPGDITNNGRRYPFSSVGQFSTSPTGALTTMVDDGHTLRWAGSRAITPTTMLSWGLNSSQGAASLSDDFNTSLDVALFKYSVTLGAAMQSRTLSAGVPAEYISRGRGAWYTNAGGTGPVFGAVTQDTIFAATITQTVPSRGASAVLCLAASLGRGRRRLR